MRTNENIMNLVEEYPHIAPTLNFLGIQFYEYHDNTLAEICEHHQLDINWVVGQLEQAVKAESKETVDLRNYPMPLIIAYLRHSHYLFIKEQLRYIAKLIRSYPDGERTPSFMRDLKLVFPDFMMEFIEHIYEEEDDVFSYILALDQAQKHPNNVEALLRPHLGKSIAMITKEHQHQDQELKAIQDLVYNYEQESKGDKHAHVILQQLKSFAQELKMHAKIENEILLPKAEKVETSLRNAGLLDHSLLP